MNMGVNVREKIKGSGIWWVFINHDHVRKSKKIGPDKKLAEEVAEKLRAKIILGDMGFLKDEKKSPTLKEYVDGWQDSEGYHIGWSQEIENSLKNSTRKGYKNVLETYILPTLGKYPLPSISSRIIKKDLVQKLFNRKKKKLRSNTIKNIKNCLSAILREACTDEYISVNPALGVLVPKPEDEKPSREPMPFTWDEVEIIEDVFKDHFSRHYPMVLCGLRTGLRMGELIALQWQDLDFHNKWLYVQRNITRGKITTPKSKSGYRYVRMTNQLCQVLKEHRNYARKQAMKNGWGSPPEWLFYNEEGSFLNYGNFLSRIWNRAIKKSELLRRTPHDMRHSYATLRLSKGDSLAEVSKEMGHKSTKLTFDTYFKWLPKESTSNIDELDTKGKRKAPKSTLGAPRK